VAGADRDDLIQDVLMVVVRRVAEFDHRGSGAFRAWLRGILANQLRKYFRERQPSVPQIDLDAIADPDSVLGRQWDCEHDQHLVARAMRLIEGDFAVATWQAFRWQIIEGQPPAEVAEQLGMSLNAVILAKSRIMKRLRQELQGLTE
jgi:RNA polymerase sigma-70 factor (ECF subfamily)